MSASAQMPVAKSYSPKKAVITEQPAGELVKYKRSGAGIYIVGEFSIAAEQNARTSIVYAEDGTTVYFSNFFNDNNTVMGESWIQGTINAEGTEITVPMGQSIFYNDELDANVLLAWGTTTVDESGMNIAFTPDETVTEVVYNRDPETGVITMTSGEGDLNAEGFDKFNATGLGCYWTDDATFAGFLDWELTLTPTIDAVPAVPANPILGDDAWFDAGDEDGYTCFDFMLPTTDVDGNAIDPELVSFTIFTDDDKPFVFEAATYSNDLSEDMTEIPYSVYHGGYDFDDARVYFYCTNEGDNPMFTRRIGIQVYYTVDGVRNESDIVYWELPQSAIEQVNVDRVNDGAVYNMMGQRVGPDAKGLLIKNGKKVLVK